LGAHLAQDFGLPVPFQIALLDDRLADGYNGAAASEHKAGYVFASKQEHSVTELKLEAVKKIDAQLKIKGIDEQKAKITPDTIP